MITVQKRELIETEYNDAAEYAPYVWYVVCHNHAGKIFCGTEQDALGSMYAVLRYIRRGVGVNAAFEAVQAERQFASDPLSVPIGECVSRVDSARNKRFWASLVPGFKNEPLTEEELAKLRDPGLLDFLDD